MPINEYKCKQCGRSYEALQKVNAEPLKDCKSSKCDGEVYKRVGTRARPVFAGTGWMTKAASK